MPLTPRRRSVIASKRSDRVTFVAGFIPVASWGKALCPLISGALCAPDSRNNRPHQWKESHLACPLGLTGYVRRRCLYQTLLERSLWGRSEIINRDDSYRRLSLATRLATRPSRRGIPKGYDDDHNWGHALRAYFWILYVIWNVKHYLFSSKLQREFFYLHAIVVQ